MGNLADSTDAGPVGLKMKYAGIAAAMLIYMALAVYLYQPYFRNFNAVQYIIPLNSVIAATGCFVLSRRWVGVFAASLFAGAVYGFCPFVLAFAAYHPVAGLPAAMLPWLFCPAAFVQKWISTQDFKDDKVTRPFLKLAVAVMLSLLPFAVVALFFWLCAKLWFGPFFPLPGNIKLQFSNLAGLAAPLVLKPHTFMFSLYHVPLAVAIMGLFMYLAVHRVAVLIIVGAAVILAVTEPVFYVSPIVWVSVPVLFCSILAGLGAQGIAWSSNADRKWILACVFSSGVLVIAGFGIGGFGKSFHAGLQTAIMHGVAAIMMGSIFFMARAGVRWHLLRWILLGAGIGIDVILGATYIVDGIF
jgi:hypothetical protein